MLVNVDWGRPALDSIEHGQGHLDEVADSALRHALVAFDQAASLAIAGYLVNGPGMADTSRPASIARERRAFWELIRYVERLFGESVPIARIPLTEITRLHRVRNKLQHEPIWLVPDRADTELMAAAARGLLDALYTAVPPDSVLVSANRSSPPRRVSESPATYGRRPTIPPFVSAVELRLHDRLRAIDPARGGIHETEITDSAADQEFVASTLDGNREIFRRLAPGVWTWRVAHVVSNDG